MVPDLVRTAGMMVLIQVPPMASASVTAAAHVSMRAAAELPRSSVTARSCARGHQPLRLSNTRMQPSGATKDGVTGLPASIASTTLPTYC